MQITLDITAPRTIIQAIDALATGLSVVLKEVSKHAPIYVQHYAARRAQEDARHAATPPNVPSDGQSRYQA